MHPYRSAVWGTSHTQPARRRQAMTRFPLFFRRSVNKQCFNSAPIMGAPAAADFHTTLSGPRERTGPRTKFGDIVAVENASSFGQQKRAQIWRAWRALAGICLGPKRKDFTWKGAPGAPILSSPGALDLVALFLAAGTDFLTQECRRLRRTPARSAGAPRAP